MEKCRHSISFVNVLYKTLGCSQTVKFVAITIMSKQTGHRSADSRDSHKERKAR